jgi:hypothetical protein
VKWLHLGASDEELLWVVREWADLLVAGDYERALALHASRSHWTPALMKSVIDNYSAIESRDDGQSFRVTPLGAAPGRPARGARAGQRATLLPAYSRRVAVLVDELHALPAADYEAFGGAGASEFSSTPRRTTVVYASTARSMSSKEGAHHAGADQPQCRVRHRFPRRNARS